MYMYALLQYLAPVFGSYWHKESVLLTKKSQGVATLEHSLVPRPPHPAFVACSTKSGGRPGRTYHVMCAAADVTYMYCS